MKILKILFACFGLILIIAVSSYLIGSRNAKIAIFSINYNQLKNNYSIESERDFHQDGFSLRIDSIAVADANYFINPPSAFFDYYPKQSGHSSAFQIFKWKRTPIQKADTTAIH